MCMDSAKCEGKIVLELLKEKPGRSKNESKSFFFVVTRKRVFDLKHHSNVKY